VVSTFIRMLIFINQVGLDVNVVFIWKKMKWIQNFDGKSATCKTECG
jgi:hypothetical protein